MSREKESKVELKLCRISHQMQNLRKTEVMRGEHVLQCFAVWTNFPTMDQSLLRRDRMLFDGVTDPLLEFRDLHGQGEVLDSRVGRRG